MYFLTMTDPLGRNEDLGPEKIPAEDNERIRR